MKTKSLRAALLCGLALSLDPSSAQALSITLSLVVTTAEPVEVGETVDVEVRIAGLVAGELPSLRSYNLTVSFDETRLDFTSGAFTSVLGTPGVFPGGSITMGPTEGTGTVQFSQISLITDLSLQPDDFTLATLTFKALAVGDTDLEFLNLGPASLANQSGVSLFPDLVSATGADVTVPEPGLLGLAALGLAATTRRLRRRR